MASTTQNWNVTTPGARFLQASLFTSVLAFGVAAMAVGMGILFLLIGLGIRDVEERTVQTALRT
jgi:hypothetical protein